MQAIAEPPVRGDWRPSITLPGVDATSSTPTDDARALLAASGMETRWRMWVANLFNGRATVPSGTPVIP